jgi:hypothetical protein
MKGNNAKKAKAELERALAIPDFNSIDSLCSAKDSQALLRRIALDKHVNPAARMMAMKLFRWDQEHGDAASMHALLNIAARKKEDRAVALFSRYRFNMLRRPVVGWDPDNTLFEQILINDIFPSGRCGKVIRAEDQSPFMELAMDSDAKFVARIMAVILLNVENQLIVSVADPTRTIEDALIRNFAAEQLK